MFARYTLWQPTIFLFFCTEFTDVGPNQAAVQGHEESCIAVMCVFFDQDLLIAKISDASCPVFFICPHKQQPHLARFEKRLPIDDALLMPFVTMCANFVFHETPDRVAEHLMLFFKNISIHYFLPLNSGLRFCRKAAMPSLLSAVPTSDPCNSASRS